MVKCKPASLARFFQNPNQFSGKSFLTEYGNGMANTCLRVSGSSGCRAPRPLSLPPPLPPLPPPVQPLPRPAGWDTPHPPACWDTPQPPRQAPCQSPSAQESRHSGCHPLPLDCQFPPCCHHAMMTGRRASGSKHASRSLSRQRLGHRRYLQHRSSASKETCRRSHKHWRLHCDWSGETNVNFC